MPTSVALGGHFETFVRDQVRSGRFNNGSEVVRAGLRLLEETEQRNRLEIEALRAKVEAGLGSGKPKSADAVLKRLETKYRATARQTVNGKTR